MPAVDQRVGVALEQVAVGGQREVARCPSIAREHRRPAAGTRAGPAARRRSAARRRRPSRRAAPTSRSISSKREDLGALEPGQPLGRHAVLAAEVAAVGDRDPQVGDRAGRGRRTAAGAAMRHASRRSTSSGGGPVAATCRDGRGCPRAATASSRRCSSAANADAQLQGLVARAAGQRRPAGHVATTRWVHIQIVLNIALRLFRLLHRRGVEPARGRRLRDEARATPRS